MTVSSVPVPSDARRGLPALLFVVFVAMMGFGTIIPILPFFALGFGASATEVTWAMGAYSLGQLIASPLWGRLSDAFGRRPVLIVSMIGATLCYIWLAEAGTVLEIGLARFAAGLMAGNVAAAFAYGTDVSTDKTRPATLGLVGAAFGLGFIVGPALGGFLAGETADAAGLARIAHVSAGMAAFAALACIVFLPESHPRQAREDSRRMRRAAHARARFQWPSAPLLCLYGGGLLMIAAFALMESVFGIWSEAVLDWTPRDLGIAFAVFGVISAALQGGAAGRLAELLGVGRMLRFGLLLYVLGFSVIIIAYNDVGVYVGMIALAVAAGLAGPALQTLVSLQAKPHERGQVMGSLQGALSGGRALGPFLAGPAFDAGGSAAPFMTAVALLLATLALVWIPTRQAAPPAED